ncbi:O-methyltransferase [soil metagenome]
MDETRWSAVDDYISDLFAAEDSALVAALEAGRAGGLPQIQVSPAQGKLLQLFARAIGARRILEIGTLAGYSTIWLARALPSDGRLVSLEIEPAHAEVARANVARAGLSGVVEIRVGSARETLAEMALARERSFDMVFIDADKESYPDYLEGSIRLCRPGSLVVADNVVRQGGVIDEDSADPRVEGIRQFNALLASDPRLSATIIQTVGSKGYDGLAVALLVGVGDR